MSVFRFGNPWHGHFSPAGFTLENGTLHPEWTPPQWSHYSYYQNFGAPATTPENAVEVAAGVRWKSDVVLCGQAKRYNPAGGIVIGHDRWLYKCPDGTIYNIAVNADPVNDPVAVVTITPWRAGVGVPATSSFTCCAPSTNSNDWHYLLNNSPDGSRCAMNLVRVAPFSTGGSTYEWRPYALRGVIDLTVSGGSVSAAPTVSHEYLGGYGGPPITNIISETVGDTSTTVETSMRLCGYAKTGARVLIKRRWTDIFRRLPDVPLAAPYDYRYESYGEKHNDVLENDTGVFSLPVWKKHNRIDYALPPAAGQPFVDDIVWSETENAEWINADLTPIYLSNALIGYGGLFDGTGSSFIFAHSFYMPINATPLIGQPLANIPVAAVNPRTGAVALGLGSGFI